MALPWRVRKSVLKPDKPAATRRDSNSELCIPPHFRCPISLDLMKDPVTAPTGISYDRQFIEAWLEQGNDTCPVTSLALRSEDLIPNHSLRKLIQDWCVAHRAHGIERIPTPKIPVTGPQAADTLSEIAVTSRGRDGARCRQLVAKVRYLARESERNRRCFVESGARRILAGSFAAFAGEWATFAELLEEVLAALAAVGPLDEEAASRIASSESLNCLVAILRHGNLAARLNAALVAKELMASGGAERERGGAMAGTKGLVEALVKLVKEPISSHATKAALVAVFRMVSCEGDGERVASKVVGLGLVPVLVEMLVEPDKSLSEKALAVLDGLLSFEGGRKEAQGHALTVPALVKKMFRVSELATELVVSAMWKLCKESGGGGRGRCLREAVLVGAFQKLLLMLQIGCSEATKERATALLKLLNACKGSDECVDTIDFNGVKKPF